MRRILNGLGSETGTSAIETALTFPIMMFAVLVIIQFGTLVYARQSAEEAARYGVRRGVVNIGNPGGAAIAAADEYAASALPWGHTTQLEAPGGVVGSTMRVRVSTIPPNLLGPIMGFFGGSSGFENGGPGSQNAFQVTAVAEGRMEGW
ncbi:MAG: pilus assembly protein [Chloroflexi bacterium]|nr:pilus assembly protein [Chloroflexota bacterium]